MFHVLYAVSQCSSFEQKTTGSENYAKIYPNFKKASAGNIIILCFVTHKLAHPMKRVAFEFLSNWHIQIYRENEQVHSYFFYTH